MAIRRYDKDLRSKEQAAADEKVSRRVEEGLPLRAEVEARELAVRLVKARHEEQRLAAAQLGLSLGQVRRALGVTQGQLAAQIGTNKSNISRVESGRYGGISLESFLLILHALQSEGSVDLRAALSGARTLLAPLIHDECLDKFRSAADCIEAA